LIQRDGNKNIGDIMIKEETYGITWGTILIVIGLIILLVAFVNVLNVAQNPSKTIEQWVPEKIKTPTAAFSWWSDGKSVEFSDTSVKGSYDITNWHWDFGDGSSSSDQNPSHEYSTIDSYTVVLEVKDTNGNSHTARTGISLVESETSQGQTQAGITLDLGLDVTLNRMAISILFTVAYAVIVMIGGRLLIAGCRLLRPNVQLLKMKGKQPEIDEKVSLKQK
jgi:hypothetical protein